MHARQNKRRAEARATGWRDAQRRCFARQRVQASSKIGEHLYRHSSAHTTGVSKLAVIGIVAEQQRPEVRPRAFRIRRA
jgi:hypothetical protein